MIQKYLILAIYFSILFLIGYYSSKRIKNVKDYYVGGKKLGFWIVAFSARATGESAWLFLGLTGLGAVVGVSAFWVVVGEVAGVSIAWFFMAERFKILSDKYDSITIPDYLMSRFKATSNTLRIVAATVLSVFVIIYISAQIDATGTAFESFLGINYYKGAIIGFLIVATYIFSGGFVAVVWSDLFQGLVMLGGLILLPIVAYNLINPSIFTENLSKLDPSLLNVWGSGGFTLINIFTIIGFLGIGLGFLGSPQLFIRFMSIKNISEIKKGRWVAIAFTLITDSAAVMIGIFGRYLLTSSGQDVQNVLGNGGQNVLPLLVENIMPLTLISVYLAAVLSAIMSTIDSLLVVASSAVVRDFYQQILHPEIEAKKLSIYSKYVTLIMALLALTLAIIIAITSPERTIFWFVIFGWSGLAATFCPTIILSLFWNGFSERGAIASMLTGFLCMPILKFGFANIDYYGIFFVKLGELPVAFSAALITGVIVSALDKNKKKLNELEFVN